VGVSTPGCSKVCRSPGGLTQHENQKHRHHADFGKRDKAIHRTYHPLLDGKSLNFTHLPLPTTLLPGTPCDPNGYDLEQGALPEVPAGGDSA
jgi:hypothetical protein